MFDEMPGGCQCGRVRYVARVDSDDAYLCHCRMCQRATGGVSIAFVGLPRDRVTWAREPDRHASSPIARRGFCAACGTPLTFEYNHGEGLDLTVGSFDDPHRFQPRHHYGVDSMHPQWLDTGRLPQYRLADNPNTVNRWIQAIGKLPD